MNSSKPIGSVIMMFSMMRRIVTLQAEPDQELHHHEEERAQPDERGEREGHQVGAEEARGVSEIARDAGDDAETSAAKTSTLRPVVQRPISIW